MIQEWGDKRSVDDLYRYLSDVNERRSNFPYFWAAMAELTPSTFDVILRPNDGLRKLADLSNRNVTIWYRDLWSSTTNIVAVDFFHSTDIVEVAIDSNTRRAPCFDRYSTNGPLPTSLGPDTAVSMVQERTLVEPNYHGPRSLDVPLDVSDRLNKTNATGRGRRRPKASTTASPVVLLSQP